MKNIQSTILRQIKYKKEFIQFFNYYLREKKIIFCFNPYEQKNYVFSNDEYQLIDKTKFIQKTQKYFLNSILKQKYPICIPSESVQSDFFKNSSKSIFLYFKDSNRNPFHIEEDLVKNVFYKSNYNISSIKILNYRILTSGVHISKELQQININNDLLFYKKHFLINYAEHFFDDAFQCYESLKTHTSNIHIDSHKLFDSFILNCMELIKNEILISTNFIKYINNCFQQKEIYENIDIKLLTFIKNINKELDFSTNIQNQLININLSKLNSHLQPINKAFKISTQDFINNFINELNSLDIKNIANLNDIKILSASSEQIFICFEYQSPKKYDYNIFFNELINQYIENYPLLKINKTTVQNVLLKVHLQENLNNQPIKSIKNKI